jgi:hypothetical protein
MNETLGNIASILPLGVAVAEEEESDDVVEQWRRSWRRLVCARGRTAAAKEEVCACGRAAAVDEEAAQAASTAETDRVVEGA